MNHFQIKKLTAAVVAVLGAGVAGSAFAAVTLGTPVKFASEMTVPANLTNNASVVDVLMAGLPTVNALTVPITYRVDLTGGVKFAATPSLVCSATTTSTNITAGGTGQVALTATLGAGGNGQTYALFTFASAAAEAKFVLSAGAASTAADTLYLSAALSTANCTLAAANYTADDQVAKSVSAGVSYIIGGQTYADGTTRAGTFITFSKAMSASFAAPGILPVIDGVTNSTKFVNNANMSSTLTANLGTLTYATAASTVYNSAGTQAVPTDILSSAAITISGATLAAAATGKVYISTAAGATCGTSVGTVATTTGSSITITGVPVADFAAAGLPMEVCIIVPGTTTIQESTLGGSIAAVGATGFTPNVTATANAMAQVLTNGQTRNAYLIHSAASTAKRTNIRLINKSGLTGDVLGTLYNEAGTDIGGGQKLLTTFTADQQIATLQSADIETTFGTALAATAKGHIKFYFSKGNFEVLNFTQDIASGALTLNNTSTTNTQ